MFLDIIGNIEAKQLSTTSTNMEDSVAGQQLQHKENLFHLERESTTSPMEVPDQQQHGKT